MKVPFSSSRVARAGLRGPGHCAHRRRSTRARRHHCTATYTGSAPTRLTTKVVSVEKMEDFTRLTLAVPPTAAANVKVGTAVRVNGAKLVVASVGGVRNGDNVNVSFGIAMVSASTRDLTTGLYPDATVDFEMESRDFEVIEDVRSKEERERQDGLPGSRLWYSNTLPWYSKIDPTLSAAEEEMEPELMTEEEEQAYMGKLSEEEEELREQGVDASRSQRALTDYERYTLEQSRSNSGSSAGSTSTSWTEEDHASHASDYSGAAGDALAAGYSLTESSYAPPPPPPPPPTTTTTFSYDTGREEVTPDVVDNSWSSTPEAELIESWSHPPATAQYSSDPSEKPPHLVERTDENYHNYSASAAASLQGIAPANTNGTGIATTYNNGVSPEMVVGALENMARRNNYLTDRVEKLLDVIESKASDAGAFANALAGSGAVVDDLELSAPSLQSSSDDEDEDQASVSASLDDDEEEEEEEEKEQDEGALGPSAVREPSVEVCVMQHPGALCCTRSEIAVDQVKRQATITLHTSVRAVEGRGGPADAMTMADYVALGAQAISEKAREMMETKTTAAVWDETNVAKQMAHERITELLQNGRVIWVEGMGEVESKFGHPCYKLRLECTNGTGAIVDCVFKPAIEGNGDGWHRAGMEYVAYKLSRMLGMDIVPPAAYRRPEGGIELDYKKFDEGAFMYWVEGGDELVKAGDYARACETGCWGAGVDPRLVLSDTRILDVLLHNSDRHSGHFLFARHWTEGGPPEGKREGGEVGGGGGGSGGAGSSGPPGDERTALSGSDYRPVLIDHAASFRQEAFVSMEHENAFQTGPTLCVGCTTYLRLRFLDAKAISDEFGSFLSQSEQAELLERRNRILEYLDNLVETQGYDKTVIH